MMHVSLSWMVLYGAARFGFAIHDIFFNAVAGRYLTALGLPNVAVGFLANERSFVGSLLQPIFGAISDRMQTAIGRRKPFMLVGVPVSVAGFLLLLTDPPIWLVVVIFIVGPLFLGLAITPYMALLPDAVVEAQRNQASGINVLLGFIGSVGFLVAAGLLTQNAVGVHALFLIVAVALAVGFGITLLTVQEPEEAPVNESAPSIQPLEYVRGLLSYGEATKYVASYFFFWLGMGGITPFVTRFGSEVIGMPEAETYWVLLAFMIATAVFAVPAGWLGSRFGAKRVMACGLFAMAALVLLGSQTDDRLVIIGVLTLAGVANALTTVLAYPLFTEMVPATRMGELTGLSTMVWSLAQPLGATLLGAAADQTGTLRSVFIGAGIAMLIAGALLLTVRVESGGREPVPR